MECICQVAAWWMELRLPLGSSMSFRCTAYQRGFTGSTEIIIQYEMHNSCTWIFIFYCILFLLHFWSLKQKKLPSAQPPPPTPLELLFVGGFMLNNLIQPRPCPRLSGHIFIEWVILVLSLKRDLLKTKKISNLQNLFVLMGLRTLNTDGLIFPEVITALYLFDCSSTFQLHKTEFKLQFLSP